jgi:PKD repeat protein
LEVALSYTIVSPLVVECSNLSDAESYLWSFGDGNFSAEINPTHAYALPGSYTLTLIASICNRSYTTSQTIVVSDSGIHLGDMQSFYLYPNPVEESIQLMGMEHDEVVIYNMSGSQVERFQLRGRSHSLDVSNWPSGIYIVERPNGPGVALRFMVE